ncbi:MAG: hypothetical protein IJ744_00495 [Lachnospiraceae bacterium]|nr:hypothetical protein [Lachnospiraceae bacterium]
MKHVVRVLIFILAFCGAVVFFTLHGRELTAEQEKPVEMTGAKFPVLFLEDRGALINPLHGYAASMQTETIRDSLTPLVKDESQIKVIIAEDGFLVRRLEYQVADLSGKVVQEDSILAFNEDNGRKYCNLSFPDLSLREEYTLSFTVTTETNKKIHYYTRVRLLEEDSFTEKLSFVNTFLSDTMSGNRSKVSPYLETLASAVSRSLAHVTDNASVGMVCWGGMMPQLHMQEIKGVGTIGVIPRILEMSEETMSVALTFLVDGVTDDGTELYEVQEFYRIRYTPERTWLLNFDRTIEQIFDPADAGNSETALKLGIRDGENASLFTNESGDYVAFVQNRELWLYQVSANRLRKIYAVRNELDPLHTNYDQFDVKVLDIDKAGNVDFMVAGYLMTGAQEGKTGIVLYHYDTQEEMLREKVMIPMTVPFERIELDIGNFAYVNASDMFFFALNESIYSYDLSARKLTMIAEKVSDQSYVSSEASHYVAWQETDNPNRSTKLFVMDLESGQTKEIDAPTGQCVIILGKSYENLIYGYVRRSMIEVAEDGSYKAAAHHVFILDTAGNVIKEYERENRYVTGISVEDNIVTLHMVDGQMQTVDDDYIINQISEESRRIHLTNAFTDTAFTEYYISIGTASQQTTPVGSQIPQNLRPSVEGNMPQTVSAGATIELEPETLSEERYYVYAKGGLYGYEMSAVKAVALASETGGTVVSPEGKILWSRADQPAKHGINTMAVRYDEIGESTLATCAAMILAWEREDVADEALVGESSPQELLEAHLDGVTVMDLTGRPLSEMFYYVGRDYPVICKKDETHYVLLYGYDGTYVKYADPDADKTEIILQSRAERSFDGAGDVFYAYIP